uniref:EOG090X0464 n=1 Tax=Daphnia dolichocephala TaxID=2282166 RepID=A0A4Y7M051_9CRUS|nr:EOG090X0464 [Daphnia dolichocephala]
MSSDDSFSPIMTMRRVKKASSAASKTTPVHRKRDLACKLSLRREQDTKENADPFRTPDTASKQKVSAAFIFSSCKKKSLTTSNYLPGHTILVGDSSDEEFISCDSFTDTPSTARNAEVSENSRAKEPAFKIPGPVLNDSFDSLCVTNSLQERLAMLERRARHVAESSSETEDSLKISRPYKKVSATLRISSDDEIPSSPESKPYQPPQATAEIYPKGNPSRARIIVSESESELDDVFASLTIEEPPPPIVKVKKVVKPRQKKNIERTNSCKQPTIKTPSFLASLSSEVPQERRHTDTIPYMKNFRKTRDELTIRLFKMFNEEIFNNHFRSDFSITWNARLTRTAGYCRHFTKRENGVTAFESRIELSVKVVDTPCRLRDTLIHELCHAATWMIDNCRGGHGPVWRAWANRALETFPELPPITRCHNYEISYKFYYNCVNCKYSAGRHSKSIDTATHVCPICRGQLQLSKEPTSSGTSKEEGTKAKSKTPRTPNAFALFVKDNYGIIKSSRSDLPHAAVMKLLSAKFAESKLKIV